MGRQAVVRAHAFVLRTSRARREADGRVITGPIASLVVFAGVRQEGALLVDVFDFADLEGRVLEIETGDAPGAVSVDLTEAVTVVVRAVERDADRAGLAVTTAATLLVEGLLARRVTDDVVEGVVGALLALGATLLRERVAGRAGRRGVCRWAAFKPANSLSRTAICSRTRLISEVFFGRASSLSRSTCCLTVLTLCVAQRGTRGALLNHAGRSP